LVEAIIEWIVCYRAPLQYLGVLSLLALVITPVIISLLVIRIPTDYFLYERDHFGEFNKTRHPLVRMFAVGVKNAMGIVFLLAGVAMLVLPGQGIITILIGLTLIDFPGKRKLERRLISQKKVLSAINWMRTSAGKPPLCISKEEGAKGNGIYKA
jgi:hypothetical protein